MRYAEHLLKATLVLLIFCGLFLLSRSLHAASDKKVQAEGQLEVLHEDYANKPGRYRYFLKTDKSRREVKFKRNPPQIQSGSRVKISGEESAGVLMLDSGGGSSLQVLALASSNTFGEQKVAVILVNFADSSTYQPITVTKAVDVVFNQVNSFQKEASYEQTWLTGNVFGWYTLPLSYTSCETSKIASAAQQAARDAGANLSGYTRFVYFMSYASCGGWSGLASVGGTLRRF